MNKYNINYTVQCEGKGLQRYQSSKCFYLFKIIFYDKVCRDLKLKESCQKSNKNLFVA